MNWHQRSGPNAALAKTELGKIDGRCPGHVFVVIDPGRIWTHCARRDRRSTATVARGQGLALFFVLISRGCRMAQWLQRTSCLLGQMCHFEVNHFARPLLLHQGHPVLVLVLLKNQ